MRSCAISCGTITSMWKRLRSCGLVHLLKPEGWADPGRILDGHRGTVVAGRQVVRVAEHGPPVRVPAGLG